MRACIIKRVGQVSNNTGLQNSKLFLVRDGSTAITYFWGTGSKYKLIRFCST